MALIYKATLTPPKIDLLTGWLPSRSWFSGASDVRAVGAYRFDDPAGEVGLESFLLQAGDGPVLQAPLTYRAAPLAGAEDFLVGTTEHSVLGRRWVYDGCADPVWVTALAHVVLTGGTQAEEFVDQGDGRLEPRPPTATVRGSGTSDLPATAIDSPTCRDDGPTTLIRAGGLELVVVRMIGAPVAGEHTLTGRWADAGPAVLAAVTGGASA